jgi:hypothetical protein
MYRWMAVAIALAALVTSGCSTARPPAQTPAAPPKSSQSVASSPPPASSSEAPAGTPLGADACVEITQANLDLATATNADDARKAGEAFTKYDLPASVNDAVQHFVGTGGAQFDDPQYDKYNNAIESWIKQVCPL